jgi:UDP-glucuronate decarboxylase
MVMTGSTLAHRFALERVRVHILVAGAAGFIGSHLCDRLLADGHHVTGVDNLVTGRLCNIEHLRAEPRFDFIEHDIVEPLSLQVDQIYHLASPASPVGYMQHPIETHLTNSIGTYNLLRLAHDVKARLLFASTSEAYGDPLEHPQRETYHGNVNPVGPRSCYDESKRFGESITMEFVRHFGLDARIIRIFNTYGPRNDPKDGRMIPNFIMRTLVGEPLVIFGDGSQTRAICYVSDLVTGIVLAMETPNTTGEVINLGNPDERSVEEIGRLISELCGSESSVQFEPARPDDPVRRCPDITKAKSLLNWEPNVTAREGLQRTIEYFATYLPDEHRADRISR